MKNAHLYCLARYDTLYCSKSVGHGGEHAAHNLNNRALVRWPQLDLSTETHTRSPIWLSTAREN